MKISHCSTTEYKLCMKIKHNSGSKLRYQVLTFSNFMTMASTKGQFQKHLEKPKHNYYHLVNLRTISLGWRSKKWSWKKRGSYDIEKSFFSFQQVWRNISLLVWCLYYQTPKFWASLRIQFQSKKRKYFWLLLNLMELLDSSENLRFGGQLFIETDSRKKYNAIYGMNALAFLSHFLCIRL